MTGTVQIKKGRPNYFIVLDYIEETTGKRMRPWISTDIPVKGNNKRAANERLKEVLAEHESQTVDYSKDVPFDVFIANWLENARHTVESTTYDTYKIIVNHKIIPYFKPKRLKVKDLTPLHIQQFVNHYIQIVSANTVRRYLVNLSRSLDSAVKQNKLSVVARARINANNFFMIGSSLQFAFFTS